MAANSSIEWTDATWNPTVGCTRVSEGCRHCYAFQLHDQRHAAYLAGKKVPPQYAKPFKELQLMPDRIDAPLHWRKPRRIFVNSMSDLFHQDVPDEFLHRVYYTMENAHWHTFQVLTKRPERMRDYLQWRWGEGRIPSRHIWHGVSVENRKATARIDVLRQAPSRVRFLSAEPLLEDLGPLDLSGMHWVISGCESGPNRRDFRQEWDRAIERQCREAGVAFFRKQIVVGGRVSHEAAEWGEELRVREWPGDVARQDGAGTGHQGTA